MGQRNILKLEGHTRQEKKDALPKSLDDLLQTSFQGPYQLCGYSGIFKPGRVVGPVQISGLDWVTRVNFNFFYKSKWRRFNKKKKSTGFDLVLPDHRVSQVLNFFCFFTNLIWFQPRVDPLDCVGF